MTDWNGVTSFELDLLGRIVAVNDHNNNLVSYTYDAVGNQTSVTYPDGTAVNYTYDLLGRLTNVKDAEGQNTAYTYDAAGQLIAQASPNGWNVTYQYDPAGQLLRQYDEAPTKKAVDSIEHKYTYDPQGNILTEYRSASNGVSRYNLTHTYDALNRMLTTTGDQGYKNQTYTYDSLGNLIYEQIHNKGTEYWYNSLNQQVKKTEDGKDTYVYTYDKRGNLVTAVYTKFNTVTAQYTYDATNRIVNGVNAEGEESRYIYNGLGYLVANEWIIDNNAYGYHGFPVSTDNGKMMTVRKDFTLDYTSALKSVILEQEDGSGGLTYRYVYGLRKLSVVVSPVETSAGELVTPDGEVKLFYHSDRLFTTEYLTDNVSGKITSFVEYDPWGNPLSKTVIRLGLRELDLVTQHTVHPYDQVLGVYFAQARMYDANGRRFLAMDLFKGLITYPQSLVQYTYVINNPLKYYDPSGLILVDNVSKRSFGNYYEKLSCWVGGHISGQIVLSRTRTIVTELSTVFTTGNFVTFTDDTSYGGRQEWFESELDSSKKNSSGCGAVAAANIIAYYAQIDYNGVGHLLYSGDPLKMAKRNFVDLMDDMYENYTKQTLIPGFGVWFAHEVYLGIVQYAQDHGVKLYFEQMSNIAGNTLEDACKFIREGLMKDCPILLEITFSTAASSKNNNKQTDGLHYMTITRIEETWKETWVRDAKSNMTISNTKKLIDAELTLSNWGKETKTKFRKIWEDQHWGRALTGGANVFLAYLYNYDQ